MISTNLHTYVLMILIGKSLSEKCIPFFKSHDAEQIHEAIRPDHLRRLNLLTGEMTEYEYIKPNKTGLCSVDYDNKLEGKTIRVGVDELYPYVMYSKKDREVTGLYGEIWIILEKVLRFKSIYSEIKDFSCLETGKFDLIFSPTSRDRASVYYTFSTSITQNSYSLFMLSDGVSISQWWYLHICDKYVWFLIMFVVLVLTITMICISIYKNSIYQERRYSDDFSNPTYSLLCILGATTGQGFTDMPRTWSLRFCAFTALQLGMLISCGFNSTLTSYLALRSHQVKMSSLDDVWKYGTHSLCVRNNTVAHTKLKMTIDEEQSSTELKMKKMQLVNRHCPDMNNENDVRKYLCKTGFIFVESYDRFLRTYHEKMQECSIIKVPGHYWPSSTVFVHYAGSKYRRIINMYVMRLQSSGILKYLENKWTFSKRLQKPLQEFQAVELGHIQILLSGLLVMMFISIIICCFENLWFYFYEKKKFSTYIHLLPKKVFCKRH